ncbi:hypothetical protein C8Q79DRAFT_1013383 [Trametes meyenii]|nr:hypothetical protein C8Q79DRAFT_1013383 [Trametes meyenii]
MSPKTSPTASRPSTTSPVTSSYPRTRSQTKALSPLKRKNSDKDTHKLSKPAKVARKKSSDPVPLTGNLSPEELLELSASASSDVAASAGRTMWPAEVPRSMLFTFSANPTPFKMYDGATRTSTTSGALAPAPSPRFPATGPERMFDHSWRVTFIDSTHTSTQKAIAASERRTTCTPVRTDVRDAGVTQVYSGLASSPSKKTLPVSLSPLHHSQPRQHHPDNENVPPPPLSALAVQQTDVATLGIALYPHSDGPLTPLYRPVNLPQNPTFPLRQSSGAHSSFPTSSEFHARSAQTADGVQDRRHELPVYAPVPTPGSSFLLTRVAPGPPPNGMHSAASCQLVALQPFADQSRRRSPVMPTVQMAPSQVPGTSRAVDSPPSPEPFHFAPHRSTLPLPPHPGGYPNMPYSIRSHSGADHPTQTPLAQYGPLPLANAQFAVAQLQPQYSTAPSYQHQAVPLAPFHGYSHSAYPVSLLPPAFSFHPIVPAQTLSAQPEAPWATFYESIKSNKRATRGASKRRSPAVTTGARPSADMASCNDPEWENLGDGIWAKGTPQTHRCPFCPRTFSLANGLAIHLKWHWGASSLDWKKGISRSGKTIERALRDADRRREEEAQRQVDQDFPGVPLALSTSEVHAHAPSNALPASPTSTNASGHPFAMPIIAHSTFGTFDFPFGSSQSSEPSPSPSTSPSEAHHPFGFPPPVVASGSMCSSHPRTPDLLPDTSSSSVNSASTGVASPTWSENLFGCDGGDIDAEGEEDDLFGDCIPPGTGGEHANDASADSDPVSRVLAVDQRSPYHSPGRLMRPVVPDAPRLGTLRLPPTFYDDDEDEGNDVVPTRPSERTSTDHLPALYDDVGNGLTPLSGLPPLQSLSLPELDYFEGLSIF